MFGDAQPFMGWQLPPMLLLLRVSDEMQPMCQRRTGVPLRAQAECLPAALPPNDPG
jgi:hypothetical protein